MNLRHSSGGKVRTGPAWFLLSRTATLSPSSRTSTHWPLLPERPDFRQTLVSTGSLLDELDRLDGRHRERLEVVIHRLKLADLLAGLKKQLPSEGLDVAEGRLVLLETQNCEAAPVGQRRAGREAQHLDGDVRPPAQLDDVGKLRMQDVRAADLDGERGLGQDRVQAQRLRLAIEYRLAGQPGLDPLLDRFRLGLPTHTVDLPGVRLGLEQTRDQGGLEVSQLDRLGLVGDERSVAAGERGASLPP